MKKLKKLGLISLGILGTFLLIKSANFCSDSNGMGSAGSGSPSPSYQYHLQIFHAY